MNLFADNLRITNLLSAVDVVANTARKIESCAYTNKEEKQNHMHGNFEVLGGRCRNLAHRDLRIHLCLFFSFLITSNKQNEYLENNICIVLMLVFSSINVNSFTRRSNCNHCKCLQTHSTMFVSVNKFQMNFHAHLITKSHIGRHKSIFQVILNGYEDPLLIKFYFSSPFGVRVGLWPCQFVLANVSIQANCVHKMMIEIDLARKLGDFSRP